MSDKAKLPVQFKSGPAHTFGWLRRGDLELLRGTYVWESPDGRLHASPIKEPTVARYDGLPQIIRQISQRGPSR